MVADILDDIGGEDDYKQEKPMTEPQETPIPKQANSNFQPTKQEKKQEQDTIDVGSQIIKTANINFQVKNFKEATDKIRQIVKNNGGYLSSSNEKNNGYAIEGEVVIRILSKNFDKAVKELLQIAVYQNFKDDNAEDVTEEFVDVISRIKAKKEVEKRYYDILSKAKTITEILEVEEKLRLLREEIEVKEGRLKFLKDQVQYSTIRLNYYETIDGYTKPPKTTSFWSKVVDAFGTGWQGLLNFLVGMIYLWPILIVLALIIWWWRKVMYGKNQSKKEATVPNEFAVEKKEEEKN